MKWALVSGERSQPYPGLQGQCPTCTTNVIPRCGHIKDWHWAHASGADCDSWSEPETEWHRSWKNTFPLDCQEVPMGPHRADIKLPNMVIELQHSPISSWEIQDRESFYGNMIWVVDAEPFAMNFDLCQSYGNGAYSFRWKWPRTSWQSAQCPIFLDLGHSLFHLKKIHWSGRCRGWGKTISANSWLQTVNCQPQSRLV